MNVACDPCIVEATMHDSEVFFTAIRHIGWRIEKEMAIVVVVTPEQGHHSMSGFQRAFSGKCILSLV